MVPYHFGTFLSKKCFLKFLTSEISGICHFEDPKFHEYLNFRVPEKKLEVPYANSIFFPHKGRVELSNAPTLMFIRLVEVK